MATKRDSVAIHFTVNVWYDPKRRAIHIGSSDPDLRGFHSTVTDRPRSTRLHQALFEKLANLLAAHGKPAPLPARGE
jgi:hypothetical protein